MYTYAILAAIPIILPVQLILALGTITCLLLSIRSLPLWLTFGLFTQLCSPTVQYTAKYQQQQQLIRVK